MTVFAIIAAVFAVSTTIRIIVLDRDVRRLRREVQRPPIVKEIDGVQGTAKFTHQTRWGLIDIDLHR